MLRTLTIGLAILHFGPAVAFALLAFGCDGPEPLLGAFCSGSGLPSFAWLTGVSWLLLILGVVAVRMTVQARRAQPPRPGLRVRALLAVLAFGTLLGVSGWWLTGSEIGFVAIPAALAVAWLFVTDPLACEPAHEVAASGYAAACRSEGGAADDAVGRARPDAERMPPEGDD